MLAASCSPVAAGFGAQKLAGAKTDPATMGVRAPILTELVAYKTAKSEAAKETHRQKLRELFESIEAGAAERFQTMLGRADPLAVTFQGVLGGDSIQRELLVLLEKKYLVPCPQAMPPLALLTAGATQNVERHPSLVAAPPPPAALQGITLPVMRITDEAAFTRTLAFVGDWITSFEVALRGVPFSLAPSPRVAQLLKERLPTLRRILDRVKDTAKDAFHETDRRKRVEGIKRAGDQLLALMYAAKLEDLEVNIVVITAWANDMGVARSDLSQAAGVWHEKDVPYNADPYLQGIMLAAFNGNLVKIADLLPGATLRYQHYEKSLNDFIVQRDKGAVLSTKVVAVANIVMTGISIYQVARTPVIPVTGSPPPPIVGTLPGGAALGGVSSVTSVATALASLQQLVASGVLNGAIVAGVGLLGNRPSTAVPALQQLTSLAVKGPNQPGGNAANPNPTAGGRPPPKPGNWRGRYNAARAAQGKARLPEDWEAHHRIPQQYRNHPEYKTFDFDDPSNIRGVKGWKTGENVHQQLTDVWRDFAKTHPNATRKQIEAFERIVDSKFKTQWWK